MLSSWNSLNARLIADHHDPPASSVGLSGPASGLGGVFVAMSARVPFPRRSTPPTCAGCAFGCRPRGNRCAMSDFMDKAKDVADQHDEQVDKGLERAGDEVDERTGGKYG